MMLSSLHTRTFLAETAQAVLVPSFRRGPLDKGIASGYVQALAERCMR